MPQSYDNVQFEFLNAARRSRGHRGIVLVRDGEMVLEVECPGDRPYVIRGNGIRDFFSGRHEGLPGDVPVQAKWIRLDDIYIGTWIEDSIDYLFTFRLPTEPSRT